jgi:hypothetical protein
MEDNLIVGFDLDERGNRINTVVAPVTRKVEFGKAWAFLLMMAMMKTGKGMRKSRTGRYRFSDKQRKKK